MHALGRSKFKRGARLAQLFACRALHRSKLARRSEIDYPVLKMLPHGEVFGQRSNLFGREINREALTRNDNLGCPSVKLSEKLTPA